MNCPQTHEWYELERGTASREDAEALRRHLAACGACRDRTEDLRAVAASLERLARRTRLDLGPEAEESLGRRARVHGLVGRPPRRPLTLRLLRRRWARLAVPAAAAAAGFVLIVVGLLMTAPRPVVPRGALEELVRASNGLGRSSDLPPLAPMARAAAAEELARPDPALNQVADLLLVAYIAQRPRENRQVDDVRFLIDAVWGRRRPALAEFIGPPIPWTLVPRAEAAEPAAHLAAPEAGLAAARERVLAGDYSGALAALPADDSTAVLRAWCLTSLGRATEAVERLADVKTPADVPMARLLRADVALEGRDVAEALHQYEDLAADRDRFWFEAGYLCRYELADAREAGVRFVRVRDAPRAAYVAKAFSNELAAAREKAPEPLFVEDFESYDLGHPQHWALVQVRGGEFRVVEAPGGGKALQQDEINYRGAEWLTGGDDWADYTLQADVKIIESQGDYMVGVAAYRRPNQAGYVLQLSPFRLALHKQFTAPDADRRPRSPRAERLSLESMQAHARLPESLARDRWYTLKIRVQRVAGGVSLAGKVWQKDAGEPLAWQVVWTDMGQGGVPTLVGGLGGVQVSGARALIDNVIFTRNETPRDVPAAP